MGELATYIASYISDPTVVDCVMACLTLVMTLGLLKLLALGLFSK